MDRYNRRALAGRRSFLFHHEVFCEARTIRCSAKLSSFIIHGSLVDRFSLVSRLYLVYFWP